MTLKVEEAVHLLRECGHSEVHSLMGDLKNLFWGPLEKVSEAFPFLGEYCTELEEVLDTPRD